MFLKVQEVKIEMNVSLGTSVLSVPVYALHNTFLVIITHQGHIE